MRYVSVKIDGIVTMSIAKILPGVPEAKKHARNMNDGFMTSCKRIQLNNL